MYSSVTGSWKMNSGHVGRKAASASLSRSWRSLVVTTSISAITVSALRDARRKPDHTDFVFADQLIFRDIVARRASRSATSCGGPNGDETLRFVRRCDGGLS